MLEAALIILSLLPFYLLGALPTGRMVARVHGVALETTGSGNVGATNVARTLGTRAGILTLSVDVAKGAAAVWLAILIAEAEWYRSLAGAVAVAGHCLSIPGYLRGGKGVATSLGAALVWDPVAALICVAIFAAVFAASRIVSAASLSAILTAPIVSMLRNNPEPISAALAAAALLVFVRHRANLQRLIEGREPRFTARPKED